MDEETDPKPETPEPSSEPPIDERERLRRLADQRRTELEQAGKRREQEQRRRR